MNPESTVLGPKSLHDFCQEVIGRHGEKWPPSERDIAEEFLRYFGHIDPVQGRASLEKLAESLGIEISNASAPEDLPGCHCCYGGKQRIVVSDHRAYALSQEHTILHELREIMERPFQELGRPVFSEATKEIHAEQFAIAVRTRAEWESLRPLFDWALEIKSTWRKVAAFVLLGAVTVIGSFSFATLPAYEDYLMNLGKQRAHGGMRKLAPPAP